MRYVSIDDRYARLAEIAKRQRLLKERIELGRKRRIQNKERRKRMQDKNRREIYQLIARQIAVFNGQIWDKLDHKKQAALLTLAASIYATVQRKGNAHG